MKEYTYINLRQRPSLKDEAAVWFHKNGRCRRKHIAVRELPDIY